MGSFQRSFRISVEIDTKDALSMIGLPLDVRVGVSGLCARTQAGDIKSVSNPKRGPPSRPPVEGPGSNRRTVQGRPSVKHGPQRCRVHRSRMMAYSANHGPTPSWKPSMHLACSRFDFLRKQLGTHRQLRGTHLRRNSNSRPTILPALDNSSVESVYVGRSLQHEVIAECLRRADRVLYLPDPGTDVSSLGMAEDIIRSAAERLTDGMAYRATGHSPIFSYGQCLRVP